MPCVNHTNKAAAWKCRQCGTEYCDNCVKKISIKQTFTCVCPKCGEMCEVYKVSTGKEKSELGDETSRSLMSVFDAFVVPFRKGGPLVLLFGTFLLVGADFLIKFGCMLGFAGIFAKFMVYSYVMRVIADAASGEKVLPFWEFDDIWNDVVGPGFRMIFLGVVALLPAAGCFMGFAITRNPVLIIPGIIFAVAGIFVFPMMLLIASVTESFSTAISPPRVITAIFRVFLPYLLVFVLCAAAIGIQITINAIVSGLAVHLAFAKQSFILALIAPGITNLFAFYCWLVTGQMLGTLYYCEEEKLWG